MQHTQVQGLILAVMHEKALGSGSRWGPYLAFLPSDMAHMLPYWSVSLSNWEGQLLLVVLLLVVLRAPALEASHALLTDSTWCVCCRAAPQSTNAPPGA
jgi:hypothetical protein